jgi:type IV secretory pathway TrbF-like protein
MTGAEVWEGWGSVILVVLGMALTVLLVGLVIWQGFKTAQTRMITNATTSQEAGCRALAEQATQAQQETAAQLAALNENVAKLNARIAAVERLPRDATDASSATAQSGR